MSFEILRLDLRPLIAEEPKPIFMEIVKPVDDFEEAERFVGRMNALCREHSTNMFFFFRDLTGQDVQKGKLFYR